jgi:hypothetical protein
VQLKKVLLNLSIINNITRPCFLIGYIFLFHNSSCVNWGFFGMSGPVENARFTRVLNWPTRAKKAQFTHERVEYNVFFLFDEPLKGSKSLKIFKISLTFRFDKW